MADLTVKAAKQCPNASIIWGAYSQGAQVTHKAAALLSASYYSRIKQIVLFGDPYDVRSVPFTSGDDWLTAVI